MIKNIIFDIAGIFITSDEEEILKMYSGKLDVSYEEMRAAYDKFYKDYEAGILERTEFTRLIFNEVNREVPKDFWQIRLTLKHRFREMFDFLEKLKQNYNCYFISNEGKEYWKEVDEKLKISENFIEGIVSFEAGVRKPDTKIFRMLIQKNNLNPEETLFIDDSEGNLKGAEELGINGIHFTKIEKLRKDLEKLGLKWNT